MEVQPSMVLLQKTLLNIEGLGRQLYPQLNLWDTAQPFLENWVQERYSPQSILKRLQRHAPSWLEQLPQVPDAVFDSLQHSREREMQFQAQQQQQEAQRKQRELGDRRRKRLVLAAIACLFAALVAMPNGSALIAQIPPFSWILGAVAVVLLWPRKSGD
jgi:ubiquinone biosynthesis protein